MDARVTRLCKLQLSSKVFTPDDLEILTAMEGITGGKFSSPVEVRYSAVFERGRSSLVLVARVGTARAAWPQSSEIRDDDLSPSASAPSSPIEFSIGAADEDRREESDEIVRFDPRCARVCLRLLSFTHTRIHSVGVAVLRLHARERH